MRPSRLSTVSLAVLQQEIQRRQKLLPKLVAQRDTLNEEIAELESVAQLVVHKQAKPQTASKKTRRGLGENKIGLADTLSQFMKGKTKVTIAEALDGVLAAGYKSGSKNFRGLVNHTLLKNKRFKNVGRGEFTLKA